MTTGCDSDGSAYEEPQGNVSFVKMRYKNSKVSERARQEGVVTRGPERSHEGFGYL